MTAENLMMFQRVKQSIIDNVLRPAEMGRFITVDHQRQSDSAEAINANRQVTVYYSESEFPKNAGKSYGDVINNLVFIVELAVAASAEVDLAILDDENVTANERAEALLRMSTAGMLADRSLDELIAIIYQTLMDVRNEQLGMKPPADRPKLRLVADRWVDQVRKDMPASEGGYFTLTASMRLTCRVKETIWGEQPGEAGGKVFDNDIVLEGDDITKQGVAQTTP